MGVFQFQLTCIQEENELYRDPVRYMIDMTHQMLIVILAILLVIIPVVALIIVLIIVFVIVPIIALVITIAVILAQWA